MSTIEQLLDSNITIEQEHNNFLSIISSIDTLTEAGIISINEKLDFSSVKEKISTTFDKIKKWFKEHVIDKLKELWTKIRNFAVDKIITPIKNNKKFRAVEFNTREDYADEYGFSESTILLTEASKRELQLKVAISRLIDPVLFFKADNYINFSAYRTYFELIKKYLGIYIQKLASNNPKNSDDKLDTALDDEVMNAQKEFGEAISKNGKMFIGPISKVNGIEEVEKIKSLVVKDLEKRVPSSTISAISLISIVEDNLKSSDKFMNDIKNSIVDMNTLSSQAEWFMKENKNMNKFTFKIMTDIAICYRKNAQILAELLTFVSDNYKKSSMILQNLKLLNEIL